MPVVSLIGAVVALVLLLPVRVWLQRRWTGSSGIVLRRAPAGAPRTAAGLLAAGTALTGLGPLLHLLGVDWAWTPADPGLVRVVGLLALVGGTAWAFWAQVTMREAWRIGQDDAEALRLITSGPFARVRHPIYSGMIAIATGVTLLDPTPAGLAGVVVLTVGAAVQAMRVEEPRLRELHGTAYWDWARETGRFLPRLR